MTAPTRVVYGPRNTYRLDPYVRDVGGRFAPKPATTPPPVEVIAAQGQVVVVDQVDEVDEAATVRRLFGGAVSVCDDPAGRNRWRVRVIRLDDGTHRVDITPDGVTSPA